MWPLLLAYRPVGCNLFSSRSGFGIGMASRPVGCNLCSSRCGSRHVWIIVFEPLPKLKFEPLPWMKIDAAPTRPINLNFDFVWVRMWISIWIPVRYWVSIWISIWISIWFHVVRSMLYFRWISMRSLFDLHVSYYILCANCVWVFVLCCLFVWFVHRFYLVFIGIDHLSQLMPRLHRPHRDSLSVSR